MRLLAVIVLFLVGCAPAKGPRPAESYEVYEVELNDGRVIECISSRTNGGYGVLDCNWNSR